MAENLIEKCERLQLEYAAALLFASVARGVEGTDDMRARAKKLFGETEWDAAELAVERQLTTLKVAYQREYT